MKLFNTTPFRTHLLLKIRLAPFAMLSLIQQTVSAYSDNVFALQQNTNTSYSLNYNTDDFPNMRSDLIQYCNAIISSVPEAIYQHTNSPQCVSERGALGPFIDLGIEIGKELTQSFQVCLNLAMKQMCDEYFNTHDETGSLSTATIVILSCIAGLVCISGCMAAGCRRCYTGRSFSASYAASASYEDITAPILTYPNEVVIVEPDRDHDHHGHNSSVTWNP